MIKQKIINKAKKEPIYWFYLLEEALEHSDKVAFRKAKLGLLKLGVYVEYLWRRDRKGRCFLFSDPAPLSFVVRPNSKGSEF